MTNQSPTSSAAGISWAPDQLMTSDQVPPIVAELAGGAPITWVWQNELGGATYRVDRPERTEYVKWAPDHPEIDLELEARKLIWAGAFVAVPRVVDRGRDSEHSAWLHTEGIAGSSAIAPRWKDDPRTAVRAIGSGLRMLHDRLPVADCPWTWQVADRVQRLKDPRNRVLAEQAPPIDRLVVCHGDACSPNTLLGDDGRCVGHVDFGSLGVADRWADLAIATYAATWNYQPAHEDELLDAYGIDRDDERIDFYRRLWDAT